MFYRTFAYLIRFTADAFHIYSITVLISKIRSTKSCSGLSLKTQLLYLIIFMTRYFDIFFVHFNSKLRLYNFIMKIVFVSSQLYIIFLIHKYNYTYEKRLDNFNIVPTILVLMGLSFIFKSSTYGMEKYVREYLWTFSILLECVAIVPQLLLLQETGEAEVLTSRYIFTLGMYRLFYVISWVVKRIGGEIDYFLMAAGVVQSLVYFNFFVLYYRYIFYKGGSKKIPF